MLALAFALAVAAGCSRLPGAITGVNLPPEIEILDARAAIGRSDAIRVRWAARDPDGRVKSIGWSVSAPGGMPSAPVRLPGSDREGLVPVPAPAATWAAPGTREPELLKLWAVDDAGESSPPATLAFFAQNVAPTVTITSPQPSTFFAAQVKSSICVSWNGIDPDGVLTQKPVKYKWTILTDSTPLPAVVALANPDSIWRYYAPIAWAGWDSTSSETTFVTLRNLVAGTNFLFVITCFDEAGDYDPVFSTSKNMLRMNVLADDATGPQVTVQSAGYFHQFYGTPLPVDPGSAFQLEVPWGAPLSFTFTLQPYPSQSFVGCRWVLDPVDPADETPRSGPSDLRHWSAWSAGANVVDLGPQGHATFKRESHLLYVQVRSGYGGCNTLEQDFVSTGLFHYVVVRPTLSRQLLIVDDTRLELDRLNATGCLQPYTQPWPSATELDTFLYARGGVPWRCTVNPTTGVLSSPGLFAGFAFDTLGTRGLLSGYARDNGMPNYQDHTVPLSLLADYRHVIWITDRAGALLTNPPDGSASSMTTMRFWSEPATASSSNPLAAYARMGGKVWLVGATATAACLPWDRQQNNSGGVSLFSSGLGEIAAGRMPWDAAHLRSDVSAATASGTSRSLGRLAGAPGAYATLPFSLVNRSTTYDPLPPTRLSTQAGLFNVTSRPVEGITAPNAVLEDVDPDPGVVNEASVQDTLYAVTGGSVPGGSMPAMTLYHGSENGEVLWSGFDIWSFRRADCATLVSWVLQDLWGLVPSAPIAAPAAAGRAAPPPWRTRLARGAFAR